MKNTKANAEIKQLKEAIKALREGKKAAKEHNNRIVNQYFNMEGMYGTKVYDDNPLAYGMMHYRGYYFEYAPGMEEKEDAERAQILKEKISEEEIKNKYDIPIRELENKINLLKYGKTTKQIQKEKEIKRELAYIKEIEKELEHRKNRIKQLEKEIAEGV